jgi:hypothetical protein
MIHVHAEAGKNIRIVMDKLSQAQQRLHPAYRDYFISSIAF